jgi:carbon monoxide dehydrogenase subunit G
MELKNSFTVPVSVDVAWAALMNLEQVAGCIPGAVMESTTGDEFTGKVRVKLGPVLLTYNGQGRFVERDETAHRAVIEASGKETKGPGAVRARITAALHAADGGTQVQVAQELDVTGKAAQFGRGVMEDVSARIFAQFAQRLAEQLAERPVETPGTQADTSRAAPCEPSPHTERSRHAPEAFDLLGLAGGAIARRIVLPILFVIGVALVALVVLLSIR